MFPQPWIRAALRAGGKVAGAPPTLDGQTLDRDAHALLKVLEQLEKRATQDDSVPAVRREFERTTPRIDAIPRAMARVIDTHAAGHLPVRIFVPRGGRDALLVFFHGGGGMLGSIASHEGACRRLADRAKVSVASVAYRLAPEHPFPAGADDAVTAWRWAQGLGAARVGVGGDSFGGLLAATVERRARAERLPAPAVTLLIYPWLDLRLVTRSTALFGEGFVLTKDTLAWLRAAYTPDPADHERASPGLTADVLGASPAIVVTAGFDPLRDEGRAYADRLAAAGAKVLYRCEADLVHGFASMTGVLDRAAEATDRIADDLATALAR